MEFDVEVGYRPRKRNMVADVLSRFPSEKMNEITLGDKISKYYTEHVCNISIDSDVALFLKQSQYIDTTTLQKPTVADVLRKHCNDALCRDLRCETDDTVSSYVLDSKVISSRRSRLNGAAQQVKPANLRPAILYRTRDSVGGSSR